MHYAQKMRYLMGLLLACLLPVTQTFAASSERPEPSAALSIGLGGGVGGVDDEACQLGRDCDGFGSVFVLSAHFNMFLGPITLGGRFVRDMEDESQAKEVAALIGLRPGRSPVSIMIGPGKIHDANSGAKEKVSVLSWEVLIAPHNRNIQFIVHGASGDVDYAAFSFAVSFGKQ